MPLRSPSCIKHLRLLKQFLVSLAAVRRGASPPKFKADTFNYAAALDLDRLPQRLGLQVGVRLASLQSSLNTDAVSRAG